MMANWAILGGFGKMPVAPGWTKATAVAVLGGGELDLSAAPPGPAARLTAVAILGGIDVLVPPGTKVSLSGLSLLGGREVKIEPGEGPTIDLRAVAVLGGIAVKPGKAVDATASVPQA
jgi:hypothetical protein